MKMDNIKFFKIYLWSVVILIAVSSMFTVKYSVYSIDFDWLGFLQLITWLIALISIYGYCYQKKIFIPIFWKIYLPALIIFDIYGHIASYDQHSFYVSYVAMIIQIFQYIGQYLYAYKTIDKLT